MTESANQMHLGSVSATQKACDYCGAPFTPKRDWSRFCGRAHRNAFHQSEARRKAIEQAAPEMYAVLREVRDLIRGKDIEHVWVNYPTEPAETLGQRIDKVIGALKSPEPIQALQAKLADLKDTLEAVNKDADRRDQVVKA